MASHSIIYSIMFNTNGHNVVFCLNEDTNKMFTCCIKCTCRDFKGLIHKHSSNSFTFKKKTYKDKQQPAHSITIFFANLTHVISFI